MVEELRHVVVGNFDKVMRVCVTKDAKGTGLLAMGEFKKTLYLELGLAPAHIGAYVVKMGKRRCMRVSHNPFANADVIFSSIGCADSGFMDYSGNALALAEA